MMQRVFFLSLVGLIACGDDDFVFDAGSGDAGRDAPIAMDAATDAGSDAGPNLDGGPAVDVGGSDAGSDVGGDDAGPDSGPEAGPGDAGGPDAVEDAGPMDAGPMDAGRPDAGGDCHGYTFGRPAVDIEGVSSLPTMTGGTIPRGIYDAISLQTTGMARGMYRGTWVFEDDTTLQSLDQITLSGAPPPLRPRTARYRTAGSRIQRTRTCGGDGEFDNEYRVREEAGRTFLDVRQDTLMFTFQRR